MDRFVDCENWRKEFKTDDLVRDFNYVEKPKVFEYYPQYYHKTDKVSQLPAIDMEAMAADQIGRPTCVH